MNWVTIIGILAVLGVVYYLIMLVRIGKGLDVLVFLVIVAILIIIGSFIMFIKGNKIG